ncbi:MAG: nuclear transport factor 2 family protein [Nonomuraea sp.]|nr:nuclear transport factor 2 family protein [Nonomuraea sp.]
MEEIQHFYARHLQLLDSGEADGWAATFTEHGSFLAPGLPEPVVGRAALAAGAKARHRQLEEAGEVHRHWHGMIAATPSGEEVEVRCYALIIATPAGGPPRLHRSCVCEDVLVPDGEHWLIRRRRVTVDGG